MRSLFDNLTDLARGPPPGVYWIIVLGYVRYDFATCLIVCIHRVSLLSCLADPLCNSGHDDSLSSVEAELAAQRQSCYTYNLPTRSLSPSRMACYVPPAPPMMMIYAPPVSPRMVSYAPAATPRMNYAPPVSPRMNYAPAGAYGGPMSHRAMFR